VSAIERQSNTDFATNSRGTTRSGRKKRARTAEQKRERNLRKYPLLRPCALACKKRCSKSLTDEHRQLINRQFWSLSFCSRRSWLDSHIRLLTVARRRGKAAKRNVSLSYSLPLDNGTKAPVCKAMFMSLGIKNDAVIISFVRAKQKNAVAAVTPTTETRGHPPGKMYDPEMIREHINSYHPQISHYTRDHAPLRRYLESHMSIRILWKDFNSKHQPVSYELYRQIFTKERITFGEPPQNECEVCVSYRHHAGKQNTVPGADYNSCELCQPQCEVCLHYSKHLDRARAARHEYQLPVPDDCTVLAADMQRVILLPKMTIKEHFFVSRLVVFNETFASLSAGQPDYVILWHEALSSRTAGDVASAYVRAVVSVAKPNIVIWADNCTAQNKKWTLYTSMACVVNMEWGPDSVTIKYLEKGHTFMKADSVHGAIGRKLKQTAEVHTYDDFVALCQEAGKNIKPVCMAVGDFYKFQGAQRQRKVKGATLPLLAEICEVRFSKGSRRMKYKTAFDGDERESDFLKPSFKLQMPSVMERERGLTTTKKTDILKLMGSAPPAKRKFWMDIPVNDENTDLTEQAECGVDDPSKRNLMTAGFICLSLSLFLSALSNDMDILVILNFGVED